MGKALYREYRPRTLADVAGQPHITRALERSLQSGVISHAFLFTGPRGVGKTSVARILAYQVNGLPYDESSNHLDIIEIDAASNGGVEDARDLRDKILVTPTSAKYKVYIIDEVHMLSKAAFNALLKTLEEPPAHAIFILATTEFHKVPETIVSRTQHYAFRPIHTESIVTHLRKIAKSEHISITDEALEVLASHGGGSFRDSIGLLDQVRHSNDTISADDVRSLLGIAPASAVRAIIDAIARNDTAAVYEALQDIKSKGITATSLAAQLASVLRSMLREDAANVSSRQILSLLHALIEVAPSPNPEIALEVILVGATLKEEAPIQITNTESSQTPKLQRVRTSTPSQATEATRPSPSTPEQKPSAPKNSSKQEPSTKPTVVVSAMPKDATFDSVWQEALLTIKKTHHSLYGVLRMADAGLVGEGVVLAFRFKLHYAKVNDPKNNEIIAQVLQGLTGRNYPISCTLSDATSTPEPGPTDTTTTEKPSTDESDPAFSTISNIFGGGELLES